MNLLANTKLLVCNPDDAAAQTDLDGAVIDMTQDGGFEGVEIVAHLGDVTANSVLNLKLMGSASADGSSPTEIAATGTKTAAASDCDDKLMRLDVKSPGYPYVFSRLLRGTANAAVNSITARLYNPRTKPVSQGSDVVKSAFAVNG